MRSMVEGVRPSAPTESPHRPSAAPPLPPAHRPLSPAENPHEQGRDHRPAECRQVDPVQPAGRQEARARRRSARRHARPARGRGAALPISPSPSSTPPGSRRAIRRRSRAACARRPRPRSSIATRSCSSSTRAPGSPRPTGISPPPCAAPASRSSSSPTRPRAWPGATAPMRPSASASASRSPFRPNTARASAISTTRFVEALPAAARLDPDEEDEAAPLVLGEEEDGSELDPTKPLRIAVLGRPNAGKSTLLNRILGEDRLLTGPEPGITRDSIGLETEWRGRKLKLFDTAGLRRRSRVVEKVEKLAVADALRAVRFAEVVVLLLDATIPFEKQDLTLADLVEREGRALVIGLNKWDLIDNKSDEARELARRGRPAPAATARRAGDPGLGPHRRACRQADGGGDRDARDLEHAHLDRPAQPLARAGDRRDAAAGGLRAAGQDPLHHPAEGAAAVLRPVRQFGRDASRRATSAISSTACARRSASFGVPIRLSMRSGGENPYAPKKRRG